MWNDSSARSLWLVAVGVLLATLPATRAGTGTPPDLPAGASAAWWSHVQRSIQLEEYAVTADDTARALFRALNPAQRFAARFDADGVRLEPTEGPNWEWGLSLTAWGRPGAVDAVEGGWLNADEDRVELDRGRMTEWFVNGPEGLEHGFTVPARPRGDGDRLVFDLALAGGLRPVFAEDGQAIDFYSTGNVGVLRYAKLVVTDALGSDLPARLEPSAGGVRIVVEDSGAVYPITVDPLATSPSWTAVGEAGNQYFAYSLATAGDVNGDGYSDVVVGSWGHDSQTGKAYLFLGGASGLATSASWTAVGEAASDSFGERVATAGDVNGDGYSDVVIGASDHLNLTGKAYLYVGGAGGLSATASWTAVGEGVSNHFGFGVATAGDVNGDGYSDVIVGAFDINDSTGKVYVYLGGIGGLSASASWTAVGEATASSFGRTVATAGDVNGDGYSDLVVGALQFNGYTGKAYLYLGGASGPSASASWTAVGTSAGSYYSRSVATAGDVNGDGYSDVIVGAEGTSGFAGRAYLYLGGVNGLEGSASWSPFGEASGDYFGYSVATAGDINGDGYSDLIVGAYGKSSFAGKSYLYLGGADGPGASASWTAVGEAAGDRFGVSVTTAGDVNGDGYSDVVVGAYNNSGGRGKAYLYTGAASGPSTSASSSVAGEATSSSFGRAVATAGDVNGDGYSDVVVGAYSYLSYTGKAYLYLGGASGLSASASWSASGQATGDRVGCSVASAGDVNGDGYADVVVGAFGSSGFAGKAYVYLGGPSGLAANASWTRVGEAANDYFGYSVASAGDVNGDGFSDVVVGAIGNAGSTGKAYLYLGGASGLGASVSWTAVGEAANDRLGYSVAPAGDVNGDGHSDVVVGASQYSGSTGKAYLYLGGASGLSASASWTAVGEAAGDSYGASAATAGDVNGDGYSDVVVGAYQNGAFRGKVYAYLGGATGLAASAAWTAVGEATSNNFGRSVATAGDVNGDGYSDVIVGADSSSSSTGRAYVYLGGASGLNASASWTAAGEATNNYFGYAAAAAGDVNGDGYSDVVVGAHGHTSLTGKVYLYLAGSGGVAILPRQRRADLSAPISLGGAAYEQQVRLGLTLRSPAGRVWRRLQWQVAPWGGVFAPSVNPIQSDANWYRNPVERTAPITLPEDLERYLWRARVRYHPAQSPFLPWSPWFTMTGNGLGETDLFSTSAVPPPPCVIPDEPVYIVTVTLDINGNPVLHFQDPNQPAEVTGYDVYRSSAPTGPWTIIGSNVVDMDEGTPNKQFVDQAGGGGGTWYYEVAAYNGACGVEGPW